MRSHNNTSTSPNTNSTRCSHLLLLLPLVPFVVYHSAIHSQSRKLTTASTSTSTLIIHNNDNSTNATKSFFQQQRRRRRLKKGKRTKAEIEEIRKQEAKELHEEQSRGGPNQAITGPAKTLVLPNILQIGVQKGGSSAVAAWMYGQRVCDAKIFRKKFGEKLYFTKEQHFLDLDHRYARGTGFWALHYDHCTPKNQTEFIMDATPNYEAFPERAYEVYKEHPELMKKLKIIIVVREPIGREMSMYSHMASDQWRRQRKGKDSTHSWVAMVYKQDENGNPGIQSFSEFIDSHLLNDKGTDFSYYAKHLKKWFELFDPKQILVLSYEKDVRNAPVGKRKIIEFLQPTTEWGKLKGKFPTVNSKNSPYKVHDISCVDRDRLQEKYEPWNQELYNLLASHERPPMEDQPFPHFEPHPCVDGS